MTIGNSQDRRQFIQDKLAAMAAQSGTNRLDTLREIAATLLSFSPINEAPVKTESSRLPDTGTVIGRLSNDLGPGYTAMHFDLSAGKTGRLNPRVINPQVQDANLVVQRYAREETNPLLIFTLPDDSGIQFVTGNLSPNNPNRLDDVLRVSTYWGNQNRTALDCLDSIGGAIARGESPERAFRSGLSVQPVTEEFFKDYKSSYDKTVARLAESMVKEDAEQFAQTLFNRLLFIHFISKKGWTTWNDNPDYLKALWTDYQGNPNQTNFHSKRLTALFHGGMNTPEEQRDPEIEGVIGQVPFLNGGLFDRTELDEREPHVDDDIILGIIGPGGLFSQYNFTVTEASPLDTEVAVDPEMLGKLFEETVNERHHHGAYYTPRLVVAFMCREALKGYIAGREIAGLDQNNIARLVDGRDPNAINTTQALEIANTVAAMKTVDPACGSGAFPLGMLQEMLTLNDTLFRAGKTHESLYQQKLDIITNNIYGADIDRLAVSTAMLRLWLSLAVDYEGEGTPDPLPNLDMKFVVGDSIRGPDPQQLDLTKQSISSSNLQQRLASYTTAQGEAKMALRKEIEHTKKQLRELMGDAAPEGVVEWRIEFADVMLGGGFDVAIANPPYVRQEDIGAKEYKAALVKQYSEAVTARSDLYCYFYARTLQFLRGGGMHVFVCSNSWLDVGYGAKLQECLLKNAHILAIYESAVERQFSTADINTIITVIRKSPVDDEAETRFISLRDDFNTALESPLKRREITRAKLALQKGGTDGNKYVGDKWGGKYLRAPDIYPYILEKCASKLVRLHEIGLVKRGITTGSNDFFFLNDEDVENWGIEPDFLQPIMTSPQESKRLSVDSSSLPYKMFLCTAEKGNLKGTEALNYIQWGETKNLHKSSTMAARKLWYNLGVPASGRILINKMIDSTSHAFISPENLYASNVLYTLTHLKSSPSLVAVTLNSTFCQMAANLQGRTNFGGGMLELAAYELTSLQVVNPNLLPSIDTEIFESEQWEVREPSEQRLKIDAEIFDALNLSSGERDAIYEETAKLVENRKLKAGTVQ